jgi:hypothetical protein
MSRPALLRGWDLWSAVRDRFSPIPKPESRRARGCHPRVGFVSRKPACRAKPLSLSLPPGAGGREPWKIPAPRDVSPFPVRGRPPSSVGGGRSPSPHSSIRFRGIGRCLAGASVTAFAGPRACVTGGLTPSVTGVTGLGVWTELVTPGRTPGRFLPSLRPFSRPLALPLPASLSSASCSGFRCS